MVEYGVVTSNKFNFLSDDESADPSQILSKAAVIKKTKSTTVQPAAPPAPTNTVPKPERPAKDADVKPRGPAPRGGRGGPRRGAGEGREGRPERHGDGENRGPRGPRGPRREDGEGRPPRREYDASRRREDGEGRPPRREYNQERNADGELIEGEDRRRGPPRGERGGRGRGAFRGDRTSGTGARAGAKRDTHGKGNWGTQEDELKGETEPVVEGAAAVEKPVVEGEEAVEKPAEAVVEEKEEEAPTFTLEEWKKLHQVDNSNFNVRKANEDKKLNLVPIKKEDLGEKEVEEFITLRREPKKKHVDISVNFTDSNRGGGGYGNRGDRPARGRGAPRGDRQGDRAPRGDRQGDRAPRGDRPQGDRPARGGHDRPARGGQGPRNQGFNLNSDFPAL
uniref:HABP4_PAI-RBP1 domain-containing protein n=1 Tax=Panagrellus redivivus TaxID=6233 RepID=A0A7E5A288_PANRE